MSVLHPQPSAESSVEWLARYRTGALHWFVAYFSSEPTPASQYDIWAGFPVGASLYSEASGLSWDAALTLAARFRSERPGACVLVLDAAGVTVG